jgi:hypothetical protein
MKKIFALLLTMYCILATILFAIPLQIVRVLFWIPRDIGRVAEYLDDSLGSLIQWVYKKTVKPALKKAEEWVG